LWLEEEEENEYIHGEEEEEEEELELGDEDVPGDGVMLGDAAYPASPTRGQEGDTDPAGDRDDINPAEEWYPDGISEPDLSICYTLADTRATVHAWSKVHRFKAMQNKAEQGQRAMFACSCKGRTNLYSKCV